MGLHCAVKELELLHLQSSERRYTRLFFLYWLQFLTRYALLGQVREYLRRSGSSTVFP